MSEMYLNRGNLNAIYTFLLDQIIPPLTGDIFSKTVYLDCNQDPILPDAALLGASRPP